MTKRSDKKIRRFTILDLTIFIAATAIGVAVGRKLYLAMRTEGLAYAGGAIQQGIYTGLLFCCPVLILWSVALVVTTLIPPRPPLGRLCRRSGFVLNTTVLLGATLVSLHFGIITAAQMSAVLVNSMILVRDAIPRMTGQFVAGALLCLAMNRRCLPLPVWTDRLGFILGLVWLAGLPVFWLSDILPLLLGV